MKTIYRWDNQNHFSTMDVVDDNYTLQGNETFTPIPNGAYTPITWTGSSWQGSTKEAFEADQKRQHDIYMAQHPELAKQENTPTPQQSVNAQTMNSIATLTKGQADLMKQMASLTAQVQALAPKSDAAKAPEPAKQADGTATSQAK